MREYLQKEWLPSIEATIRPTTYRSYMQHVDCHIVPHIGKVRPEKLRGATIKGLYAKLAQSGKKNGTSGLSALSIRHVHAVLHRALSWTDTGAHLHARRWQGLAPRGREPVLSSGREEGDVAGDQAADRRHAHATLALRAGIHLKVVRERLGHATISITLDTYSHAIPAMQEEAAARITSPVLRS